MTAVSTYGLAIRIVPVNRTDRSIGQIVLAVLLARSDFEPESSVWQTLKNAAFDVYREKRERPRSTEVEFADIAKNQIAPDFDNPFLVVENPNVVKEFAI